MSIIMRDMNRIKLKTLGMSLMSGAFALGMFVEAQAAVQRTESISVLNGTSLQPVKYVLYVPDVRPGETLPVFVATHGLAVDPSIFLKPEWIQFAERERFAILGLGFTFVEADWPKKRSYQFADVWSGGALDTILEEVAQEHPVNIQELYLYGVSAGAQFSSRYAFLHPDTVKAATLHSAGWYDYPQDYIPTRFLLTVGALDNTEISRVDFARRFYERAKRRGIDVSLHIVPDVPHYQTPEQDEMSRVFLSQSRQEK